MKSLSQFRELILPHIINQITELNSSMTNPKGYECLIITQNTDKKP